MTKTTTGWVVFLAAIGMILGLLSVDIVVLKDFNDIKTPLFIGSFIGHIAATITAFVGGKLIPESRDNNLRTRSSDSPRSNTDK